MSTKPHMITGAIVLSVLGLLVAAALWVSPMLGFLAIGAMVAGYLWLKEMQI